MKTILLTISATIFLFMNVSAKFTIIHRDKVGGDKTNKFDKVTRTSDGHPEIENVYITCVNPGSNSCPTAMPVSDAPPEVGETNIDPALANAIEPLFTEIDESFENGINSGDETVTIAVVKPDGTTTQYIVRYKWYLVNGSIQRSEMEISDLV